MTENKLKVLLIEDDEDDYILTSELLNEIKRTQYDITWISRCSEALPAMLAAEHDVCLTDFRLGESDGISLIREARSKGCQTPMILLTGQGDVDIDVAAAEAGASDYLVKGETDPPLLERSIRYSIAHAKMMENLTESELRFRSIVESARDAIVLTDGSGKIISWNNGAEAMFGYTAESIVGKPIAMLFSAGYSDIHTSSAEVNTLITAGLLHPGSTAVETLGITSAQTEFPLEIAVSSWKTTDGTFYSGIIRDITERRSLEDQLTHQALHDPLTRLANRVLFRNRVEHALTRAQRSGDDVAVLFIDLDNFKTINDTLGHASGDGLLIAVAERLQQCLRLSDTASRLGGDEFAILIEETANTEGGILVAERIREVLRTPFLIDGKQVFVGVSIGIATSSAASETPEELLRNADLAMYMAKSRGKNQYAIFENEMHDAVLRRVELETELRNGMENGEFEMVYQPIVDLETGNMNAMEALIRWNHPRNIDIGPEEFVPIAEEANIMPKLGRWILIESCTQAAKWQREFGCEKPLDITVNISSRQFLEDDLIEAVHFALEASGLDPGNLILEITEGTMLRNTETTINKLKELRSLGVRLAIDDFGTGYSSLSYLHRFPIDVLKIDRSFIEKINEGHEGAAMARAIISMSETLHLDTIAEGIETHEQIATLKDLGCEMGQGYLFARPLDKDGMQSFLKDIMFANGNGVVPPSIASASSEAMSIGPN
jgi:diguanylate cyclase (GGDEF)-like protein/PAS domain S-box-containing protein